MGVINTFPEHLPPGYCYPAITCQASRLPGQLTRSAAPTPKLRNFSLIIFRHFHPSVDTPRQAQRNSPLIARLAPTNHAQESHLVFSPTLFACSNDLSGQATEARWRGAPGWAALGVELKRRNMPQDTLFSHRSYRVCSRHHV